MKFPFFSGKEPDTPQSESEGMYYTALDTMRLSPLERILRFLAERKGKTPEELLSGKSAAPAEEKSE